MTESWNNNLTSHGAIGRDRKGHSVPRGSIVKDRNGKLGVARGGSFGKIDVDGQLMDSKDIELDKL